jgi:hypothetical protein
VGLVFEAQLILRPFDLPLTFLVPLPEVFLNGDGQQRLGIRILCCRQRLS